MVQLVSFRNAAGDLGFFQKDGNHVYLSLRQQGSLHVISEANSWQAWSEYNQAVQKNGDTAEITTDAIRYYLIRHAETIDIEIVEMHAIKNPGAYYPRIAREKIHFNYVSNEFQQDIRAYRTIQEGLDTLFNYIEPTAHNLNVYGHKIRELLILSCTEVEHLLLKMLTDNGYARKDRYSTNDYIKCKEILGLGEYKTILNSYRDLKIFQPFASWCKTSPTQTLPWYNAYNAVKHNRSDNIHSANLEHLLDAISAIHILLESQYGQGIFQRWTSRTEDRSIFNTTTAPRWRCDQVQAPIFVLGWEMKYEWPERRKYFEDHAE